MWKGYRAGVRRRNVARIASSAYETQDNTARKRAG
jgi:hypothetical protein